MHSETEQLLATLEILTEPSLPFDLPGHEDGGYIFPFVWDVSEQGEFNVMNLSRANGWLQLTDADATIKNWQEMEYLKYFPDFSLDANEKTTRENKIANLFQLLSANVRQMQSFILKGGSYPDTDASPRLVIGQTEDGDWIGVCPTVYKETHIPQKQIERSPLPEVLSGRPLGNNTLDLISRLEAIISELGIIDVSGAFGGEYGYSYSHQMTVVAAKTKELVFEKALQLSRTLEINEFHSFYPDNKKFYELYCDDYNRAKELFLRYDTIHQFMKQSFEKILMYRFSFWDLEHIYVIGQTPLGNWAGLHLRSVFVYNP